MTVEIKQLIIRARVDATPAAAQGVPNRVAAPQLATPPSSMSPGLLSEQLEREREAIVAACVREVMRRLERKRER